MSEISVVILLTNIMVTLKISANRVGKIWLAKNGNCKFNSLVLTFVYIFVLLILIQSHEVILIIRKIFLHS